MKEKQPRLPAMVSAYLNAERLGEDAKLSPVSRRKYFNSLSTLEHFMTPTERLLLREIKGQIK